VKTEQLEYTKPLSDWGFIYNPHSVFLTFIGACTCPGGLTDSAVMIVVEGERHSRKYFWGEHCFLMLDGVVL